MPDNRTVAVAMSGGVDSSVAALILKQQGYRVIGLTVQLWPRDRKPGLKPTCCGIDAIDDAKAVAYKLGILHYVVDFRDLFAEKVIADFCHQYTIGRTPNPCIRCNQYIKFGALLEKARELEAQFIATGHYSRVERDGAGVYHLKKGVDPKKDQSYFLYCLSQAQLSQTLMPVGGMTKSETRRMAAEAGLPVANKRESQEICFVTDDDYGRFVQEYTGIKPEPGPVLDTSGKILGRHNGIIHYTVGQRRGMGIAANERLYVVAIDAGRNEIVVGRRGDLYRSTLTACGLNWTSAPPPDKPLRVEARIRHRQPPAPATIIPVAPDKVQVAFDAPQAAITPGQAVVFYGGDEVVGGGTIEPI